MIPIILLFPVAAAPFIYFVKSRTLNHIVLIIYALLMSTVTGILYKNGGHWSPFLQTDPLNIVFLIIMSILFLGVAFYNRAYFKHHDIGIKAETEYTIFFLFFVASMAGVLLSTHLALMWVFIEATTLFSAPLIYVERSRSSLEAAWKYIFICSIGISLAFVGIILLSIGTKSVDSLFFKDLYSNAKTIVPFWLKFSFPFILIGLGTKMGLAPVHAWLPDAHSESPSPVSAMLSGTLLNAAFLGILRVFKLMTLAGLDYYARTLLLVMGLLSLVVSAIFILRTNNFKRMLAYSSIENMGIISLGIATGGIAYYASFLHVISHSLAKGSFFLTAGNILNRFHTKEIDKVRGILQIDKINGWLWIGSFAAISGIPPFPSFISEFLITMELFRGHQYIIAGIFFLVFTIILFGMGRSVMHMAFGPADPHLVKASPAPMTYIPQIGFLMLAVVIGIYTPDILNNLLKWASALLTDIV